jgi:DDE domain
MVFRVVLCRLRYQLSRRDRAEWFLLRGFPFTHEAVREWEERFAPLLAQQLRRKRSGIVGRRWFVDGTYGKVNGKWCYLYRAIEKAIWWARCSARRGTGARRNHSFGRLSPWQKKLRNKSPRMAMTRIRGQFVKSWAPTWNTVTTPISTAASNRTIEESNSGTTPCSAWVRSAPRSASVPPSQKFDHTFVRVAGANSVSPALAKDSYLSPEDKLSQPVSSPSHQRIAKPSSVHVEHTLVCRPS